MIVHILDKEKFVSQAISIFQDIFPGKNTFLIGIDSAEESEVHNDSEDDKFIYAIKNSKDYITQFEKLLDETELIFFHNLYKTYKIKLTSRIPTKTKVAWYFWGAELYGLHPSINNLLPLTHRWYVKNLSLSLYIRKEIFGKLKNAYYWKLFKKALQNKVDYVLTNINEDIDLLEKHIDSTVKRGWFTYFSINNDIPFESNNSVKINILIGNSSSETNNHLDALNLLKTKNIEGRKIYIPLSYGDLRYRKIVSDEAKLMYGDMVIPLIDFLTLEEYYSILKSCAVVVMNHTRQQAFNTIMMAITMGCKVFLREENTIYKCLKREGFKVFSIQKDYGAMNALDALDYTDQKRNYDLVIAKYSNAQVKEKIKEQILTILSEGN